MPIKLSELSAKTRALTMEYAGEALIVEYYPARFTPALAARMQDVQDAPRPTVAFAEALAEVLAGWDIQGDDGEPLPTTTGWLLKMPMDLLSQVAEAVGADMRPKVTNGAPSNGISSLTG